MRSHLACHRRIHRHPPQPRCGWRNRSTGRPHGVALAHQRTQTAHLVQWRGSASDATHLATEFLCRFREDRRPYPALTLTVANGEFLTAMCNDYHADEILRQVWGLMEKVMCSSAPTTSGKSKTSCARSRKPNARAWRASPCFGRDGGFTKGIATIDLIVPANVTAIQEGQKVLFHALCEMVEESCPRRKSSPFNPRNSRRGRNCRCAR